jgi:hypothetical protein
MEHGAEGGLRALKNMDTTEPGAGESKNMLATLRFFDSSLLNFRSSRAAHGILNSGHQAAQEETCCRSS